jgi:hypothetical protein
MASRAYAEVFFYWYHAGKLSRDAKHKTALLSQRTATSLQSFRQMSRSKKGREKQTWMNDRST